jgi:CDP-glucose 4,6-dehydratase
MMGLNAQFWRHKRVLVTGHTGFKGSWLSLWLQLLGAEVHGFALPPPTHPALYVASNAGIGLTSHLGDVRDYLTVYNVIESCRPEIIIHLAAQPLVRSSYKLPVETYDTNVMGVVHILEAARKVSSVRVIVNVTSDKCYESKEGLWAHSEIDAMGGHDPYSSSKGCAELITSAYRRSYFKYTQTALASARAGNVIGGGDWAVDRLIPDALRAFEKGQPVFVRNANATRPWQYVLDPLHGYLMLSERLYCEGQAFAEGWNFGPDTGNARPVHWIVSKLAAFWGEGAEWKHDGLGHPHESSDLQLDTNKSRSRLGWRQRCDLLMTLENIVKWHRTWLSGGDVRQECLNQIVEYQQVYVAN